jgi:hypothetical protein
MAKNMRIALPLILVVLLVGLYVLRGQLAQTTAEGQPSAKDGGVTEVVAASGLGGLDVGMIGATRDGGARATGDAGQPGRIPACGNCTLNPVTGQLMLQMQSQMPGEEPFNWTVQGVEIIYTSGAIANPPLKADGTTPTLTSADVNCSKARTFTVNMAGMTTTGIKSVNVRFKSGTSGVPFKRMCVKLATDSGTTILEKDCNCCNCGLCTDVGFCQ